MIHSPSCPALCRASTSLVPRKEKTWMAGSSPAMTKNSEANTGSGELDVPQAFAAAGRGFAAQQLGDHGGGGRIRMIDRRGNDQFAHRRLSGDGGGLQPLRVDFAAHR